MNFPNQEANVLEDPKFWVAVSFFAFVALSYKKISSLLLNTLDERSVKIKAELDQARALREEAQQVLVEYKRKQAEYVKEAEMILTDARRDADIYSQQAEKELKHAMDERMRHAMEKISAEEEKAIQDVRNHVVDIALAAARAVIVDHVGNMSQDDLVKLALTDIERKIH